MSINLNEVVWKKKSTLINCDLEKYIKIVMFGRIERLRIERGGRNGRDTEKRTRERENIVGKILISVVGR